MRERERERDGREREGGRGERKRDVRDQQDILSLWLLAADCDFCMSCCCPHSDSLVQCNSFEPQRCAGRAMSSGSLKHR